MRLKNILIVLAIAAAVWFFAFRGAHPGKIGDGHPKHILAIGDSLTAGFPGDELREHWPEILGHRINASVVNLSYPGDTLDDARNRWAAQEKSLHWNANDPKWKPDLIVVVLGGNDIRQGQGRAAVDQGLDAWAQQLKRADAPVLLVAVPGAIMSDPYAGAWQKVAAKYGFEFMDNDTLRHVFLTPSLTVEDHVHMNAAGQKYFADAVYDRITGGG